MKPTLTYRHTIKACYIGNFLQAASSIFAILFVPIRMLYNLSYTQFGILVSINFVTQVASDILFSKSVEKHGFRIFAICAPILSSVGLFLFACAPWLFPENVFPGFCIGTFLFAAAAGLQELLLSPILDAIPQPEESKGKSMSMLHSFFAWGQIFTVCITTLLVFFLKPEHWQIIAFIWAAVPLVNVWLFLRVPLVEKVSSGEAMKLSEMFRNKIFILILFVIIFGGAGEVVMAQWASAFIERGLALPKLLGDMIGVCGFSFMLAVGRTGYGFIGDKFSIHKVMIIGSLLGCFLYLTAAVTFQPYIGIAACAVTGLCVSMLWPGSIIIAAKQLPLAGASMFALLSAGGDIGAASGSFITGRVADAIAATGLTKIFGLSSLTPEQAGLRAGLFIAAFFPLICCILSLYLKHMVEKTSFPKPDF